MKKLILFVDDETSILDSLRRVLLPQTEQWEMVFHEEAEKAWNELLTRDFDAVVLDCKMPGIDGFQLLDRIKLYRRTQKIPVVMLTGIQDRTLKRQALERGAADLLNKPIEREDLLARLDNVLHLKESQDALEQQNQELEELLRQRTNELLQSHRELVWRLGKFAEERDKKTGNHVIRVGLYSHVIAETMGLDPALIETIGIVAPLHDIGKVAISDEILFKNGPLTPEEALVMRRHCWLGAKILRGDSKFRLAFLRWQGPFEFHAGVSVKNPYLEMAATIAMAHHEKWDGSGYPRKLKGADIPLEARIVAIADVYDSLTCDRPYRPAYPEECAVDWINKNSGSHFDPLVHSAFKDSLSKIRFFRQEFTDFEKECADQLPEQMTWERNMGIDLSQSILPSVMDFSLPISS